MYLLQCILRWSFTIAETGYCSLLPTFQPSLALPRGGNGRPSDACPLMPGEGRCRMSYMAGGVVSNVPEEGQWLPKAREELTISSLSCGKASMLFNMTETKNNIYVFSVYFLCSFCCLWSPNIFLCCQMSSLSVPFWDFHSWIQGLTACLRFIFRYLVIKVSLFCALG